MMTKKYLVGGFGFIFLGLFVLSSCVETGKDCLPGNSASNEVSDLIAGALIKGNCITTDNPCTGNAGFCLGGISCNDATNNQPCGNYSGANNQVCEANPESPYNCNNALTQNCTTKKTRCTDEKGLRC